MAYVAFFHELYDIVDHGRPIIPSSWGTYRAWFMIDRLPHPPECTSLMALRISWLTVHWRSMPSSKYRYSTSLKTVALPLNFNFLGGIIMKPALLVKIKEQIHQSSMSTVPFQHYKLLQVQDRVAFSGEESTNLFQPRYTTNFFPLGETLLVLLKH